MKRIPAPNYTQVPNAVLDAIPELEATELALILVVCRLTFGWHKERVTITTRRLAELTGFSKPASNKALAKLVERGWLARVPDGRSFAYEVDVVLAAPTGADDAGDAAGDRVTQLPNDGQPSYPNLGNSVTQPYIGKETETKETKDPCAGAPGLLPGASALLPSGEPPAVGGSGGAKKDKGLTIAHAEFIALWMSAWRVQFGTSYKFCGGQDGVAVKNLLQGTKRVPADLVEVAKAAWSRSGQYPFDSALSIAQFDRRFNDIQGKLLLNGNGAHKAEQNQLQERIDVPTL